MCSGPHAPLRGACEASSTKPDFHCLWPSKLRLKISQAWCTAFCCCNLRVSGFGLCALPVINRLFNVWILLHSNYGKLWPHLFLKKKNRLPMRWDVEDIKQLSKDKTNSCTHDLHTSLLPSLYKVWDWPNKQKRCGNLFLLITVNQCVINTSGWINLCNWCSFDYRARVYNGTGRTQQIVKVPFRLCNAAICNGNQPNQGTCMWIYF